jgi:hypothetical protein
MLNVHFWHTVGPAGHVVHFAASGVRNVNALIFKLRRDRYGFHKNHVGIHYVERLFLHPVGSAGHIVHFGASEV